MSGMGKAQQRSEDQRFLTGQGAYTADLDLPNALTAFFVRSPVAFGRITAIDTGDAVAVPGVVAVLTGADADAEGLGHIPTGVPLESHDGTPLKKARRPVLPVEFVHHVGQPVAVIIAQDANTAREAADLVVVEIDDMDPALNCSTAPQIHSDIADNMAFDWHEGDVAGASRAVDAAPHQVSISFHQSRMAGVAIEGRVAAAEYLPEPASVTLHLACQGAHMAQRVLSKFALNWPPERLRVKVGDVGGGFGPKFFIYPEQACVAWASWRLERNVVWVSERTESFVSEVHARDQKVDARLGFDDDGRFQAISMSSDADMGAFLSSAAPGIPTDGLAKVLTGLYTIPVGGLAVRGFYTNTVPVDAYRGAGKPPGIYCLERLVDMAADRLGMDRVEIRRRNLVQPEQLPWRTALGKMLDGGGDYPASLEQALKSANWAGYEGRKTESAEGGQWRGIGVACNLHGIGGTSTETSRVTVGSDGKVVAWTGTQSTGQGHETVYAQILAERLGIAFEEVEINQGDSAMLPRGGGSGGSSSTTISGNTIARTADRVIEIGKQRAADKLETAETDIEYRQGRFSVVGTDRQISLFDLAQDTPIEATHEFADKVAAYPYGSIVAEVEIDPETGKVSLLRLVTCDDAGRIVNPMLLAGQSQGALVQGAGQALLEHLVYDESGQVLAGSFMDYAMPRADDMPSIDVTFLETVSPTNMLGIRGIGELGTNGAPAAIANAVFDALSDLGNVALEPPFTSDKVWRAIQQARG